MRKLREFLRLHLETKLSARAIARSLTTSPSTAHGYVSRIRVAGLTWPLPPELDHHHQSARTQGLAHRYRRPTLADAICDRLVHNAHRIKLVAPRVDSQTEHLTQKAKPSKQPSNTSLVALAQAIGFARDE